MKMFRNIAFAIAATLALAAPVSAQWQVPNHAVPVGQGGGNIGFNSAAPGTAGLPLVSNGASADPTFQAVPNAGLAAAPGGTVKCNASGSPAAPQDCLLYAVNVYHADTTVSQTDCRNVMRMGGGADTQMVVSLPLVSAITGPCPVRVWNGNSYSAGNSRGVILSGFPAVAGTRLFPGQSIDIEVDQVANAWVVNRTAGRWQQSGPWVYSANAGSDTANDCLSLATACKTIGAGAGILYNNVDNLNGEPTLWLKGGDIFPECITLQGQLTGINVGLIASTSGTGVLGGATWGNVTGACSGNALLTIADNAEWQLQNILMTNASGTSGIYGLSMHQVSVVDSLSGMAWGCFVGAGAIRSDAGGAPVLNFSASKTVTGCAGTTPTLFSLGATSTLNECGSCTTTFTGTPTFTTLYQVGGAGANVIFPPSHTFSGAATITNACSVNGPSMISKSGNTIPGTNACTGASVSNGGQVF